jgi:hypothetical protein
VLLRIDGVDLAGRSCGPSPERPEGHANIHVGVQRRGRPDELLGLVPGDAAQVSWTLECTTTALADGIDVRGPYIQGGPGRRFVYLSWGVVDAPGTFRMFRRAKILLGPIPHDVLSQAVSSGMLVGRLGLTDSRGNPLCAAVDQIEWTASSPA